MKLFRSRIFKGVGIGCCTGLALAAFTHFLFSDLIDRIEWQTYDMRNVWQLSEFFNQGEYGERAVEDDVVIVDIDERSLNKLGIYYNWDRSYYARLLESLRSHYPGAVVFDVLFDKPEDPNHISRLHRLMENARQNSDGRILSEQQKEQLVASVNFDDQFIHAASKIGVAYFGIQMSNMSDFPEHALSQVKPMGTMQWHENLHPSSAITLEPKVRNNYFGPYNEKPIIEGIFPRLAHVAADIGYVNITPDEDGVVRHITTMNGFGSHPPVYLPLSIRSAASVFGTPNDEIQLKPKKYLALGKPFKISRDSAGCVRCSYPNITFAQIQAILDKSQTILSLPKDSTVDISSLCEVGHDTSGLYISMYCGKFPWELGRLLLDAGLSGVHALSTGDTLTLSDGVRFIRDTDIDWILEAPYGYEEWWLTRVDLATLARLDSSHLSGLSPGDRRLVFFNMKIRNRDGKLTSEIPVLEGAVLRELCHTSEKAIRTLQPGMRMEFGTPVKIPVDKYGKTIIPYFGPSGKTFPTYSFYDVMNNMVRGSLEGKVILVGSSAPALFDIKTAPHENKFPGVEIQASMLNAILTNTFVTKLGFWQNIFLVVLVGSLVGFVSFMVRPSIGGGFALFSVIAWFVIAMTVFGVHHLWIEVARPVMTIIISYTAIMVLRYITEEKDRKFLQSTFKTYLSPELIDSMYQNKQKPKLGGEEGIRTAYFTDIQSFSSFSEKLGSPSRLVELLNEYLSAMTEILLAHYGTLDKYEGDAIIAFFGAPMPMDDHAHQACTTALEMQQKLGELRQKWVSEGDKWPLLVHNMRMRIGINTGRITTGNMGSNVRMNYTMMGDAVNLAARLEAAAKQYGIYTMISQFTYEYVKDVFEARQLDKIMVVGKSEPVVVYELIAPKGELTEESSQLISTYREGLQYFYHREWDRAESILEKADELEPYREIAPKNMTPSRKIISYCRMYKENPPPPEWDGVIRLTSK